MTASDQSPDPERSGHVRVSRRAALLGGITGLAGLTTALSVGLSSCAPHPSAPLLRIAGGEQGGFFLEYARLLADVVERAGLATRTEAVSTGGSLGAIALLSDGGAEAGIAMLDSAVYSRDAGYDDLTALGRVSQNSMHCAVLAAGAVRSVEDLAGLRIAIGGPDSGTGLTTRRLLAASGLATGSYEAVPLGLNSGLAALNAREVDALFWSGGAPTPSVAQAHARSALRLLALGHLVEPLRASYGPFYDRVVIPGNAYAGIARTATVGVPTLLLADRTMPRNLGAEIARLLVRDADQLVPSVSQSLQFLGVTEIVQTSPIPLHPGAAEAFRDLHR